MNRRIFTLLSFAVMMFLLGTWAATAQVIPVTADFLDDIEVASFLPMIFIEVTTTDPLPTGALYVFSTTATTNGNGDGRQGMNVFCSTEDSSSHFCTLAEIEHAFISTGVYFANPFQNAWVDNPGMLSTVATYQSHWVSGMIHDSAWDSNSCNGWRSNAGPHVGFMIDDGADNVSSLSSPKYCNETHHIACCKWIP